MTDLSHVVICEPLRTPVGGYLGSLQSLDAAELATTVVAELARRCDLAEGDVDDVILGNCNPSGDFPALGRIAALNAGLGEHTCGMQVDRRCGSGLQAVLQGVMQVAHGASDVVIAGGAESMSRVEHYAVLRQGTRGTGVELTDRLARARSSAGGRHHPIPGGMIETAENLRRDHRISREEQDALALASHRKAAAAVEAGHFADELVPVTVTDRKGNEVVVTRDEHIRPDTSAEQLARLRPIMLAQDPDATVTAGNASGQNDAAAACLVTTAAEAKRRGWRPLVRLVAWGLGGVAPQRMGLGPVPATAAALRHAGLTLADMDVIELNEAFAAQALAVLREWDLTPDDPRLNPNGSGISLGHPVGATGARILATMAHELHRREARYGLETMCIGGGQGLAAVFERVA